MKTSAIRSGMLTRTLAVLLAASPLACLGVAPADGGEATTSTTETEVARLAGDGNSDALAASGKGERVTHDNSSPCGDHTMAVVHAKSGATYVFCALGDGATGVLEELPAGAAPEASRVDEFPSAAGLLRALTPEGETLPDGLVAAVEAGAVAEHRRSQFPFVIGTAKAAPGPASVNPACTNAATFSSTYGFSSYMAFMGEFVVDPSDCDLHVWYTDSYPLVTSHQRTASANPVFEDFGPPYGTACGAKEHVLSCGGSTLFEALRQENPGDAWTTSLSFWVTEGSVATWKMYASDCNIAHDRDDMRFTGNSEPGASHRYSTIFNKWFSGSACVFK